MVTKRKKIDKLFNEYDFASEGWEPFKYRIEKVSSSSDYDFNLLYLVKEVLLLLLMIFRLYF